MKYPKVKVKKVSRKSLVKQLDDMWKQIVKERANYRSELSGLPAKPAHPHHSKGKSSYALRFDIRGGICLTSAEHFKVHSTDNYDIQTQIRKVIKKREGENIFNILEIQRNRTKTDLNLIYLQLKQELKKL